MKFGGKKKTIAERKKLFNHFFYFTYVCFALFFFILLYFSLFFYSFSLACLSYAFFSSSLTLRLHCSNLSLFMCEYMVAMFILNGCLYDCSNDRI